MAPRVTAAEVNALDDELALTDPAVDDPFITIANLMVTEDIAAKDSTVSAARLKEIERVLSAHFFTDFQNRRAQREETGEAQIIYEGKTGEHLGRTTFGQNAIALDPTGNLARAGSRNVRVRIKPLIGTNAAP